jgi:hypothetical protein
MNLYTLRYRAGMAGVQDGFIMASSLEKAEQVGRVWCNAKFNCRYIRVQSSIIADESILAGAPDEYKLSDSEQPAAVKGLGRPPDRPLTEDIAGISKRKSA